MYFTTPKEVTRARRNALVKKNVRNEDNAASYPHDLL
jgi:hypothetical protein